MTSKLARKTEEFVNKPLGGTSSMSYALAISARSMLELALDDRRPRVYRLAATHFTASAIGAITLVVAAFDAFLNEACDMSSATVAGIRSIAARSPTVDKYLSLLRAASPDVVFDTGDLEMLVDVRNEIVHYLPRPTPTLIERLEARGLLMSTPRAPGWDMGQKLPSYALAYWAFETVEAAVAKLVEVTPEDRSFALSLAPNFSLYRQSTCPPQQLAAFDVAYGLELTEDTVSGASPS
jgi:hypothetical protein